LRVSAAGFSDLPYPTRYIPLHCEIKGLTSWAARIAHEFSLIDVANAMSAFAIAGVVGSLIVAVTPQQWPRWTPIVGAMLVLVCGL
jgi:sugar phosphate permease